MLFLYNYQRGETRLIVCVQVAKQLKEQQMVMRGHRDKSMVHELNRLVVKCELLTAATCPIF